MKRKNRIETRLHQAFNPWFLEVKDETHMHNAPEDGESHFKITLVSSQFAGQPLIKRHRQINNLLSEEFATGIHALALHAYTPEEWFEKGGQPVESPPCEGGSSAR